jgi:predicted dehydrogenase
MSKIGLALIGARFAADLHVRAWEKLRGESFDIVAVCSQDRKNAESFARQFHIPKIYTDYGELLASPEIQVVDLCVPTNHHHSLAIAAADAGKHIICEKPLTGFFGDGATCRREMFELAMANSRAVQAAVKENGVKFCYAENFVYAPPVVKLKRFLEVAGGAVLDIRAEESHSGSHASYSRRWSTSGGGSLLRMGSHPVGAVLHLKHFEGLLKYGKPIRAQSVLGDVGQLTKTAAFSREEKKWLVHSWQDVEDWSAALITFEDGSKATIHATDVSLGGVKNQVAVYLSNAVAYANINPNTSLVVYSPDTKVFGSEYISEKVETQAGWQFPSPDEDWMRGYPQEMEDFLGAIRENREPVSGLDLAVEVVEVIYAAYLSAATGRRVDLRRS